MSVSLETLQPERELAVQEMLLAVKNGKNKQAADSFLRVVNPVLDALPPTDDLQSEVIARHRQELDAMIEPFLENPEASIRAEFELLKILSEARSIEGKTGLGTVVTEFATRNDTRDAIDHHFRILNFDNGKQWFVDETTFGGRHKPTTIMLQDGELVIAQQQFVRRRGLVNMPLDPKEGEGREVLKDFLKDTTYAAHLIYTRSAEEAAEADSSALRMIRAKRAWND